MDLLLNETTHDIVWNNGPLTSEYVTQPLTQIVGQRLKILLLTFQEEWFMTLSYGIPYWQRILGRKIRKEAADLIFQQKILEENGVKEITFFSSTLQNRTYSFQFRVKVTTGEETEIITISPLN